MRVRPFILRSSRHARRRPRFVMLALVTGAVLTTSGISSTAGATAGAATATAPKAETITLLTHDSFAVSDDTLAAFTKQTGITVKVLKAGDAGEMVSQAVLTKDAPLGDVLYGIDNTFLSRALDAGIFVPYSPSDLTQVPSEFQLDAKHRVTPIDHADVCVVADKTWLADHKLAVPTSLDDLTKPAYKSALVVENPATSSPGLAFLLATVARFGTKSWESYWAKLKANDVKIVDGWTQAYDDAFSGGGGGGNRPLVVSYSSDPAAAMFFADDPKPTKSPLTAVSSTCFRQVEFAGVLKGTAHAAAAKKLVDFMLSRPFQEDLPLNMFVYPVRDGAKLPDVFTKYAESPEKPLTLASSAIARNRSSWIDDWTDTVLR